jgi:hypothetical protein
MATGTSQSLSSIAQLDPNDYAMLPELWAKLTERQEIPQPQIAFPGLGNKSRLEIQRVGVLSLIKVLVNIKFTTTAGGTAKGVPTLLPGFPYKFIREIALEANGVTGIIDCRATTLRARRQRIFRNATDKLEESPAVGALEISKTYTAQFVLEIPIAHDMVSAIGSLLAQNPNTDLAVNITWASESELWKLGTEAGVEKIEGKLEWETVTFSVGKANVEGKLKTILPDLTAFHGLTDQTSNFNSTGKHESPLIRTAGQLLNYGMTFYNGEAAQIAPTSMSSLELQYGGNKKPLVWEPVHFLLMENEDMYNGMVEVRGLTHTFMDFEADNPTRDLWVPEAVIELKSGFTVKNSVEVNSSAFLCFIQETLYPAV